MMTDITLTGTIGSASSPKPKLDQPINPLTLILFFGVLAAGFLFVAYSPGRDALCRATQDQRGYLSVARHAGEGDQCSG